MSTAQRYILLLAAALLAAALGGCAGTPAGAVTAPAGEALQIRG